MSGSPDTTTREDDTTPVEQDSGREGVASGEPREPDVPRRAATSERPRRSRGVRALPWAVGIAVLVELLTIAALVFVLSQWLPLRAQEAERLEVATTARDVITRLTTWNAANGLDDTIDALAEVGTGGFADEVQPFFSGPTGQALVDSGASSTAVVQDLFVQAVEEDEARVFVVVDQSVSTRQVPDGTVFPRRAVIELVQEDGAWLAAAVTVTDGIITVPDPNPLSVSDDPAVPEAPAPTETTP